MTKRRLTSIQKQFPEGLKADAECNLKRLILFREGYKLSEFNNADSIIIKFLDERYDDEIDDIRSDIMARMEINIRYFEDKNEAYFRSDNISEELSIMAGAVCGYIESKEIDIYAPVNICELRELFISPEYRRKGLSEYLILSIPRIIYIHFGIDEGYVYTHINPYKDQSSLNENPDERREYQDEQPNVSNEMIEIMKKPLINTGFSSHVSDRDYVVSVEELTDRAENLGIHRFSKGYDAPY